MTSKIAGRANNVKRQKKGGAVIKFQLKGKGRNLAGTCRTRGEHRDQITTWHAGLAGGLWPGQAETCLSQVI